MLRLIVRVKDKEKYNELKKYGSLISVSPILNIIGMEVSPDKLNLLEKDENVISTEPEAIGRLQFV